VKLELLTIDPSTYARHALHAGDGIWIETNCYADFWIEVLHTFGFDPVAGLAFTLSSDFDGDQWTMFKFPNEDLRELYGLRVNELNVWRPLAQHVAEQLAMGNLLTIDADAWFLPDTAGITYQADHQKTTLAAQMIDLDERRLGYFHNAAYYEVGGDDFDGLLGIGAHERADVLPPYVETIRFPDGDERGQAATSGPDFTRKVIDLAHAHVSRAPTTNPLARMKKQIQSDTGWLAGSDLATFHRYAFGTCRQCGANAELAAAFVGWLDTHDGGGLGDTVEALLAIASGCKALEFGLARVVRGRTLDLESPFAVMEERWDSAMNELTQRYGS
jgi:Domain of unknown function (DUF1839)